MTTFSADGSPEAAPAAEQLAPPPDLTDHAEADTDETPAEVLAAIEESATDDEPDTKPDAEVEVIDADAQADEEPGTAVALAARFDVTKEGEDWPYDFLEFQGDKLGIRLPTRQALAAFSLASSKYVSLGVKNDLTGLFIARHLSPESYGRVFSRLMDPDESDYTVDTVGELFNAIVTAAVNADKASEAK